MLKTYTDLIVEIPKEARVAYTKKSVYITTEKHYIPEKRYNQDSRRCIGRYISPTTMNPNSNYKIFYPAKWEELMSKIAPEGISAKEGTIKRRRKRKPGPKKGSHNKKYDQNGNVIPKKPGPKPGSHHKTVKLKKDGTPKQKPGPKPGSHHKKKDSTPKA